MIPLISTAFDFYEWLYTKLGHAPLPNAEKEDIEIKAQAQLMHLFLNFIYVPAYIEAIRVLK